MTELTVFYSWQSDLPRRLSRDVIYGAAIQAMARLKVDASIEDAPRLDHDTQNLAGAPEIARTIFEKIDRCGAFLADLSFIGTTSSDDPNKPTKLLPNPNVLLDLGYAVGKVGWERVILVMNTAFGLPDDLIFDLRHRRFPITFRLGDDNRNDAEAAQKTLSEKVEEAIRAILQNEHSAVQEAISRLNAHTLGVLNNMGQRDHFSVPPPAPTIFGVLGNQQDQNAVDRLLELRLLKCDVAHGGKSYAYHWTYLGKLVLRKLGIRKA